MFKIPKHFVMPFVCLLILIMLSSTQHLTFGHPSGSPPFTYGRDRYNMNSKCFDSETGRELYVGDSFTRSGRCIRVQCLGSLQLWEDRCQIPRLEENCYRLPAANEFLDYPRCCPTYECKSYKTDGNYITDETRTYNHYGRLLREHITNKVTVMANPPVHITTHNRTDGRGPEYGSRFAQTPNSQSNATSKTSVFRIN